MNKNRIKSLTYLTLLLIIIEVYCVYLSYYNYGQVSSFIFFLQLLLNIIPLIILYFKYLKTAFILFLLIGVLIIPNQVNYRIKYFKNLAEAELIINFLNQEKKIKRKFPENLQNFNFRNKELNSEFIYNTEGVNDFVLLFSVATKSTSHYFRNSNGKWKYCDD